MATIHMIFSYDEKTDRVLRELITGAWALWEVREGSPEEGNWAKMWVWIKGGKWVLGREDAYTKALRQEDPCQCLGTEGRVARVEGAGAGASRWGSPGRSFPKLSQIIQDLAGHTEDFTLYPKGSERLRKILNRGDARWHFCFRRMSL